MAAVREGGTARLKRITLSLQKVSARAKVKAEEKVRGKAKARAKAKATVGTIHGIPKENQKAKAREKIRASQKEKAKANTKAKAKDPKLKARAKENTIALHHLSHMHNQGHKRKHMQ